MTFVFATVELSRRLSRDVTRFERGERYSLLHVEYGEDLRESQLNTDEEAQDVLDELTKNSRKYYIATVHMYINEQCYY